MKTTSNTKPRNAVSIAVQNIKDSWKSKFEGRKSISAKQSLTPLKTKDGKRLKDVDYFNLLGLKAKEIEANTPKGKAVDYGDYNNYRDVIYMAKQVTDAIQRGEDKNEVAEELRLFIDIER